MADLTTLLLEERSRLRVKSQKLREQISEAEKCLQEVNSRLVHIDGLIGPSQPQENESSEGSPPSSRDIRDIAFDILVERGREPFHYKELTKEVQARDGNLSGANAPNVLVARLVSDDRFVRPTRRGYYALRRDYPDAKNVGARQKSANANNVQDGT